MLKTCRPPPAGAGSVGAVVGAASVTGAGVAPGALVFVAAAGAGLVGLAATGLRVICTGTAVIGPLAGRVSLVAQLKAKAPPTTATTRATVARVKIFGFIRLHSC